MISDKSAIYEEYSPKVLAYIKARTDSKENAEDICSTVFLKVYEKLDSFDATKASISTWIFTITRNTLIDYYRGNKPMSEVPETISDDTDLDANIMNSEQLETLAEALKKLKEKERKVIILYYYENLKLKEIALQMGMSYQNAKILHLKALKKLRESLEE
ncbi:MAG: sigma-70 family RNA polymerase sigma factor [Lachnospiraceae bacterium]|nr:sigma-70 family RNA polymerase sigma factor [Lachnospiraceae bacterium]